MKKRLVVSLALVAIAALGERKPDNVPPGIWVREDLFAGFLADDMKTFERGEQKVDELLAEKPDSAGLQAWKMSAVIYRAVRSFEAGDRAAFDTGYKRAIDTFESLLKTAPKDIAVKAIYGGMVSTVGHRLPPDIQFAANRRASEVFLQLEELQKAQFDKMPDHHRGEVLAGVAQAAARSGQEQLARTYLTRIVDTMEGTPYSAFARDMLQRPESMKKTKIACNSCHEPNRLANFYKGDQ